MNRLLGCNVYVSEGHNLQLIRQLEALCRQAPRSVMLANTFVDAPYHRTGLTLAAASIPELVDTVAAVAQHTLAHLDLAQHAALHPRLGVVDHVSLHPLGRAATLQQAAQAAAAVGQRLAAPPLRLPVYYYGAAHGAGRRLAEVRRALGYFRASGSSGPQRSAAVGPGADARGSSAPSGSTWSGSIQQLCLADYPPDAGPQVASAAAGVVTLGAVPWVTNFNVPLHTDDMAAARAVARAVSARGGGLPGVEAMALQHGPGVIEVATNLVAYDGRSPGSSDGGGSSGAAEQPARGGIDGAAAAARGALTGGAGPEQVAAAVASHAARLGLPPPGRGYVTNKTPAQLLELAAQHFEQV